MITSYDHIYSLYSNLKQNDINIYKVFSLFEIMQVASHLRKIFKVDEVQELKTDFILLGQWHAIWGRKLPPVLFAAQV